MPGPCDHCPFRDDPETTCTVVVSNHVRFCRLVDPASPIHDPRMIEAVRRLTLEPLGRWAGPAPAPFPPMMTRAARLAGAAARFVASGLELASAEERERRLSICKECPEFVDGKCLRCGCRLKVKVWAASEHCPLDPPRW